MSTQTSNKAPNKAERRKAALLAHYATCERLAIACGVPAEKANGKRISVALWNLEKACHAAATAYCNGDRLKVTVFLKMQEDLDFSADSSAAWYRLMTAAADQLRYIFGTVPAGFFLNGDARGYALKIDNEDPAGAALIAACKLHTDWGGYGILSPEIDGD